MVQLHHTAFRRLKFQLKKQFQLKQTTNMNDSTEQSNGGAVVVSYRGLIRRVSRKLKKSESLVSMVNSGKAKSAKVSAELLKERERMRRQQAGAA